VFEKYGDWMAVHEYKLRNLENAVGDLDDLNLDVNPLDEGKLHSNLRFIFNFVI
jgi:hypothetical protein